VLDDHALPQLIATGVPIILSTDAHSVMSTDMADQYRRARQIVDDVRTGGRPVTVTAAQAREMGIDPQGQPTIQVTYDQMDPAMQRRFDAAYRKFYEDANQYYDRRPKQAVDDGGGNVAE
jgi:hypothetical protein